MYIIPYLGIFFKRFCQNADRIWASTPQISDYCGGRGGRGLLSESRIIADYADDAD